jgi:hypothetical protein
MIKSMAVTIVLYIQSIESAHSYFPKSPLIQQLVEHESSEQESNLYSQTYLPPRGLVY